MGKRTRRNTPPPTGPDPFVVLGLTAGSTLGEIERARRELAKARHPDVGGSVAEMQRINAAADEAARRVTGQAPIATAPEPPRPAPPAPPPQAGRAAGGALVWQFDHPSFTVEALPAAAFEALLLVAGWLGETIDDDPPYRLDVAIADPVHGWCRLDLIPDAGATTVSLTLGTERAADPPDIDRVRDAWIAGLNSLDWEGIDDSLRRP